MSETADIIALQLVAETSAAERNILAYGTSVHRTMASVEVSVTRGAETAEAAAKRQQAAYRDIGSAVVQVANDAMAGKNAFQIFGEQGSALAASLVGVGGTVGRVAGYLTGPWGVALTTAASLIGLFVAQSDAATAASRRQGDAARNLREAMDDLADATGQANRTQGERIKQSETETRRFLAEDIKKRQGVIDKLKRAETQLQQATTGAGRFAPDGGTGMATAAMLRINALRKEKRALDSDVADAYRQVNALDISRSLRKIDDERDPQAAANNRYKDDMDAIEQQRLRGEIGQPAFDREARRVRDRRDAALAAAAPKAAPQIVQFEAPPVPAFEAYGTQMPGGAPAATGCLHELEGKAAAIEVPVRIATTPEEVGAQLATLVAGLPKLELVDEKQLEKIGKIAAALQEDLVQGLADAIVSGKSLGDVLVDSFARAGVALLKSQIMKMFDPTGDGKTGFAAEVTGFLGGLFARPPGRASGGHVSAGQLYRVNEAGVEGFRPAGSGTIVPLGRMAAARSGGGVTVVQPLNVSFAGAITTSELMAQFKAYADGVGQAAAIGGAAMAQAKMNRRAARALPR